MALVEQPIDEHGGHDLVAEDATPLLEALVGGEDGGADLVAPVDELEEEGGVRAGDGEVADLVDDQQRRVGEDLEPVLEPSGGLCLLASPLTLKDSSLVHGVMVIRVARVCP